MPPFDERSAGSAELLGAVRAVAAINTMPLDVKIQWLKSNRSADAIQRMQSEAIVELYDVVKQIQKSLSSAPPIPGAEAAAAARAAAAKAASLATERKLMTASTVAALPPAFRKRP